MVLSRWQLRTFFFSLLLTMLALTACGGSDKAQMAPTPTPAPRPTPTPGQGQQLLAQTAKLLNTAKTIHGLFHITINNQALDGSIDTELWKTAPDKNRVEVRKSTLSQVGAGSVTVSDGKQVWQYDAQKKVVYTGALPASASGDQQSAGLAGTGGGQSQSLLNLVQTIFTHSDGTLRSSSATLNSRPVYDVHVTPQNAGEGGNTRNFNYSGEVYIDRQSQLPLKIDLALGNQSQVVFDLSTLEINPAIPSSTYTFTVPAGVQTRPLQDAANTPGTGSLTLAQAQKQAGYHLLSIPAEQADYVLSGVTALGIQGSQTYSLNYMKGNLSFTIAEGKPLANLPADGEALSLRGTSASLSSNNGISTLSWTEQGVGIRISGKLDNDQIIAIAKELS